MQPLKKNFGLCPLGPSINYVGKRGGGGVSQMPILLYMYSVAKANVDSHSTIYVL